MEKIKVKVSLELTPEEIVELNKLIDKSKYIYGVPTDFENMCACPKCGTLYDKEANYCSGCGQAVFFNESDTVPL